jgi:hypothetical protein
MQLLKILILWFVLGFLSGFGMSRCGWESATLWVVGFVAVGSLFYHLREPD